jgi:transcriptional regulator with XRE-family HTH domain
MTIGRDDDQPEAGQRGIPTFGNIIKQKRKSMNLSQEQLGAQAGCDPRVISRAESGGPTSLKKLHKIAEALLLRIETIANIDTPENRPSEVWYCDVTIRINAPADEFKRNSKRMKEFTTYLAEALRPFNNFSVQGVRVGSVLIDFQMTIATLNALCIAQQYFVLDDLHIVAIHIGYDLRSYLFADRVLEVEKYAKTQLSFRDEMMTKRAVMIPPSQFAGMPDSVIRAIQSRKQPDLASNDDTDTGESRKS